MLWTAKLRGYDEGNILAERARRFNLTVYYYPINYYEENGIFYFIAAGVVKGVPSNIRKCFRELKHTKNAKRERYMERLEVSKEMFLSITAQHTTAELRKMVRVFYRPALIHLKPAIIYPDGHEEWEVCSFNKADLDQIIRVGEKLYNLQVKSVRRATFRNLQIITAAPRLSVKQKAAVELALSKGYYRYPRTVGLKELARTNGIGVSTLQAHLRKAENKLIPSLLSLC